MPDKEFIESRLRFIESLFTRYGAVPTNLDQELRDRFSDRVIYALNGNYYRTSAADFDGKLFYLLSTIDKLEFADLGIMEDIDALPYDLDDASIEKSVRFALGIDPYPETYPDYE